MALLLRSPSFAQVFSLALYLAGHAHGIVPVLALFTLLLRECWASTRCDSDRSDRSGYGWMSHVLNFFI